MLIPGGLCKFSRPRTSNFRKHGLGAESQGTADRIHITRRARNDDERGEKDQETVHQLQSGLSSGKCQVRTKRGQRKTDAAFACA